jgi:putative FmdB family regulatory protein
MPVYEYECGSCHFHFERKQRFDEEPVAICPKCRGKARRVIHSVPVIFKGGGFYITDNRKGGGEAGKKEKTGKKAEEEKKE